jgi:hypothetical protein
VLPGPLLQVGAEYAAEHGGEQEFDDKRDDTVDHPPSLRSALVAVLRVRIEYGG